MPDKIFILLICTFLFIGQGCQPNQEKSTGPSLFKVVEASSSGLNFSNSLHPTDAFNVFDYMYFYNGGGVGCGDFNKDGLIDIFFAGNQVSNELYLNKGNMQFENVTKAAQIPQDSGWSTGVSIVDINNDGLLDIYICKVGNMTGLPSSHNQLLVCQGIDKNGIPTYVDKAREYGLDFSGFSTQAVFFDYDGDGDLDMYLLNHSIHQNGNFGPRKIRLETTNALSGDRMYRNDGTGKFTDVTQQCGINSSVIGYGLGIVVSDINLDGYPDLYIGNDFHENDYLYINQHNGKFRDELNERIMHTSQFSMGVDAADINNDGFPEIISMDMLPYDPYILKRSEGEDTWDIFNLKIGYGYNYQYTRNNLQLNRRNGHFSEVGLYAGVAATDWSWSPLWVDFDNDGLKDLFISNGIPKRLNDIDYINFVSNQQLQEKMRDKNLDNVDMEMIDKFPKIKLPSKFFQNTGQVKFADQANNIEGSRPTFSNGAVYADLDNDGDMDIVVSNIDDAALIYKNLSNENKKKPYVDISLQGSKNNINALGAKIIIFANEGIRVYEKFPVHGFLSSMEIPLHIGLDKTKVDSAFLVWPDNTFERVNLTPSKTNLHFEYHPGLPVFDNNIVTEHWKKPEKKVTDITASTGIKHKHEENDFHEFDREPLIPHMLSTEGPALAVGDINNDHLDDIYIGSSKWKKSCTYIQQRSGKFILHPQPDLEKDSTFENVDASWVDVNNDGYKDLVVVSGGNEYFGQDPYLTPRVYLNDGKGNLKKYDHAFDNLFINASTISTIDLNGDGFADLFIGGRSIPFDYGQIPHSYLLQNDGTGKFIDVTKKYAPDLSEIGFVTKSVSIDLDKDGRKDLILSLEWGGIIAFMNKGGHFSRKVLTDKKGWWNFILPVDLNNDGNIDIIAGNLGLNSRLKASKSEPVRLYYTDFDGNGKKEQLLTYYLNGRELPFANKHELEMQLPGLKKKFLYAEDFAKASLQDLFSLDKLSGADTLTADHFSNAILINQGNLNFTMQDMPWEAQLSSYRDAVVVDANGDNLPDILLVGNYYENNIQMGRYDADYGSLLINEGNHKFSATTLNGLAIKGQVRHISPISIAGQQSFILVRNNDSTMVIRFGH